MIGNTGNGSASSRFRSPLDFLFSQSLGPETTLTIAASKGDTTLTLVSNANFVIGEIAHIFAPSGLVVSVVTALPASAITLADPIPEDIPIGTGVEPRTTEMAVNGSVTPQIFDIHIPTNGAYSQINAIRIVFQCLTATAPELSDFGDITSGLARGLLVRYEPDPLKSMAARNFWSIRTNGELVALAFDWQPFSGLGQSQNGFSSRYTWGGLDKHNASLPLTGADQLQLVVQDDLTSLQSLRVICGANVELGLI